MSVKEKGLLAVLLKTHHVSFAGRSSLHQIGICCTSNPLGNVAFPKANCRNVGLEGFANEGYNLRTLEKQKTMDVDGDDGCCWNRLKRFMGRNHCFNPWLSFGWFLADASGFRKRILQGDSTLKASWHAQFLFGTSVFGGFQRKSCPARHRIVFCWHMFCDILFRAQESGAEIGSVLGLVPTEPTDPCKVLGIGRKGKVHFLVTFCNQVHFLFLHFIVRFKFMQPREEKSQALETARIFQFFL